MGLKATRSEGPCGTLASGMMAIPPIHVTMNGCHHDSDDCENVLEVSS